MERIEFIKWLKNEVELFEEHWVLNQLDNGKQDWPDDLPKIDWMEQFDMFVEDHL